MAPPRFDLAVRPGDVVDLLEDLSVARPTLDDLDAIEIGVVGILDGPDDERRRLRLGGRQVAAHRHAVRVAGLDPVLALQDVGREVPAAEEAHLDPHAAGAEGLLALHGGEDRLARVLLGPHAAQPGRRKLVHRHTGMSSRRSGGPAAWRRASHDRRNSSIAYTPPPCRACRWRRRRRTCTGCSRACPASPARSRTPRGCSCRAASARDRRRPSRYSRISWPANSSLGDSAGCVSDAPLSCWISDSGSLFTRDCAHAASIGRPLLSTSSGNMTPSERFALCEIASSSLPALRWPSIQFHRSSG